MGKLRLLLLVVFFVVVITWWMLQGPEIIQKIITEGTENVGKENPITTVPVTEAVTEPTTEVDTDSPSAYLDYMTEDEIIQKFGRSEKWVNFAKKLIGMKLPELVIEKDGTQIDVSKESGFSLIYVHATWCEACVHSLGIIDQVVETGAIDYPLYLLPILQTKDEAISDYEKLGLKIRPTISTVDLTESIEFPFVPVFLYVNDGTITDIHIGSATPEVLSN